MAISPVQVVLAGELGCPLPAAWRGGVPAPTSMQPSLLGSSAFPKRNILLIIITPSDFLLGTIALIFPRKGRGLDGKLKLAVVQAPDGWG